MMFESVLKNCVRPITSLEIQLDCGFCLLNEVDLSQTQCAIRSLSCQCTGAILTFGKEAYLGELVGFISNERLRHSDN